MGKICHAFVAVAYTTLRQRSSQYAYVNTGKVQLLFKELEE